MLITLSAITIKYLRITSCSLDVLIKDYLQVQARLYHHLYSLLNMDIFIENVSFYIVHAL